MFCQCNASTIYTVFYNYVTHIKQVVKQPIDTSLWTKLQAKKHRASTIFKRDMLAQSLGEYTVKNCLSTLCIHFIPWIQPQLTVHHFLSVGSNYMETLIVFPPYKYAEIFLFHTWSSHPRRPGQAMLCPTTPALHRAQLFTFAQGRGYKKATLPWGGLDGAQIPVVKNKTLRKAGPGAVCRLGDERHGRTRELRWENPALRPSLVLHTLNAGNGAQGGWGTCSVSHRAKETETRLTCDAGQGEGSCHGLTIRPCRCSLGAPPAAPWGGEIPFE